MLFTDIIGPGKFASGMLTYTDQFANDPNTRIVVPVTFENSVFTTAILDTGAPWCVLNPEEAEALNIDQRPDCVMSDRPLGIRGLTYQGILCRIPITFEAERGEGMTIEATIFMPVLETGQKWPHPNFIGLDGLLDRIRFAIDPEHNHFYFGAI
jgi:hypothetical protein